MNELEQIYCTEGNDYLFEYCTKKLKKLQSKLKQNIIEKEEILDEIDDIQKWITAICKDEL